MFWVGLFKDLFILGFPSNNLATKSNLENCFRESWREFGGFESFKENKALDRKICEEFLGLIQGGLQKIFLQPFLIRDQLLFVISNI